MTWRRPWAMLAALAVLGGALAACLLTAPGKAPVPPAGEEVARDFFVAYCAGDADAAAALQPRAYLEWSLPNRGFTDWEDWMTSVRAQTAERMDRWRALYGDDCAAQVTVTAVRELDSGELAAAAAPYAQGPGLEDIDQGKAVELSVELKGARGGGALEARAVVLHIAGTWCVDPSGTALSEP